MTRKILGLGLGAVAIASCTAILGGVPTTGGAGGAGGSSSTRASGSGGSGAGGTRSANGGAGGIGGGAGGGCPTEGAACGQTKLCCAGLTCGPGGTCVADAAASSSSGMTPCSTCNDALLGMATDVLCTASKTKLNALQGCVCTLNGCGQPCSQFCGSQGGVAGPQCQGCASTLCDNLYSNCRNDKGCYLCAGMLNNGDVNPNDACSGTAQDDFNLFFNCVCQQPGTCTSCSGFCNGDGFSDACKSCVGSMNNGCFTQYKACTNN